MVFFGFVGLPAIVLNTVSDRGSAVFVAEEYFQDYDETMRVLSRSTLSKFFEQAEYADSKGPLLAWHAHVTKAAWKSPADVKADLGTASILKDGRVVFNIGGNKYRLIAMINYVQQIVYIKFVGTHAQYDRIDARTIGKR